MADTPSDATHHLPAALAKIAHGALATLGVIAHLLDDPAVLAAITAIDPKLTPYATAVAAVKKDLDGPTTQ